MVYSNLRDPKDSGAKTPAVGPDFAVTPKNPMSTNLNLQQATAMEKQIEDQKKRLEEEAAAEKKSEEMKKYALIGGAALILYFMFK